MSDTFPRLTPIRTRLDGFSPATLDEFGLSSATARDTVLADLRARRRILIQALNLQLEHLAQARKAAGHRAIVTADDAHMIIRDWPEAAGLDPRWIGAVWKAGPWRKTREYVPSLRIACHARPIAVWELDA